MSNYEYKTVALPRSVGKRRRRRQSEADLVAEQLGKVLNDEATDGWEYLRAETLTTPGQRGLLQNSSPAAYVVLIFRRAREEMWRQHADPALETALSQQSSPVAEPQAPAPPVQPAPVVQPVAAPTGQPDVRFGTTSMQLVSSGEPAPPAAPATRPLGSAQD